jgi:hypothetical protein
VGCSPGGRHAQASVCDWRLPPAAGGGLAPSDERLLTQQGGCIAFEGREVVYRHADTGILRYADVDALAAAVLPRGAPAAAPTQTLRTLF